YRDWLGEGLNPRSVLQKLYIPSWPYWSFGEHLPVGEKPEELGDPLSLGAAFARLALLIDKQLDWKAVDSLADPYELVEKRREVERARLEVESTRVRLAWYKRLTFSSMAAFSGLLLVSVVVFLQYR